MAEGTVRRPLPALIALLALTLLTALVWWRVLHRGGSSHPEFLCDRGPRWSLLPQPASVSLCGVQLDDPQRVGQGHREGPHQRRIQGPRLAATIRQIR